MRRKAASLHEVAERAGVSTATVSRVARGIGQVSPETRRRVSAAIAELGFRPNQRARALVSQRHGALGVVFPGLSGPYHSEVIAGFEEAAVGARLSVLILGTHMLRESDDLVLDMADRVDGVAVLGGSVPDSVVTALRDSDCPVVVLAGEPREGVPTLRTESREATRALTGHLLDDHGYTTLAFLGTPTGSPDTTERWEGFRQAHAERALPVPAPPVPVAHDQAGGMRGADEVLTDDMPRAVVCANDEVALGVLVVALGRGVRVPEDLAITGFDDVPAASLTSPALTTVRQPTRELGARTAEALRRVIDGEPVEPDDVLATELVIRSSCGCPAPVRAAAPVPRGRRHTVRPQRTVTRKP